MLDLSKLTPAPWRSSTNMPMNFENVWGNGRHVAAVGMNENHDEASVHDAEFIALARNAFDVMMRRGWSASIDLQSDDPRKWYAVDESAIGIDCSKKRGTKEYPLHVDPFSALVEADKWYRENVEAIENLQASHS